MFEVICDSNGHQLSSETPTKGHFLDKNVNSNTYFNIQNMFPGTFDKYLEKHHFFRNFWNIFHYDELQSRWKIKLCQRIYYLGDNVQYVVHMINTCTKTCVFHLQLSIVK